MHRAVRQDTTREWRDGILDEDSPELLRWSREAKKTKKTKNRVIDPESTDSQSGVVLQVNRKTCLVLTKSGHEYNCQVSKRLDLSSFFGITVGDKVLFSTKIGVSGIILNILPRKNHLYRPGPVDRKNQRLLIAANIDMAIVFFAMKAPDFNSRLLDRYLGRMARFAIPPVICINKSDLCEKIPSEILYYKKIGYHIITCSIKSGEGIGGLREAMTGKKSVITGPSGVGKSSFVKYVSPDANVKTGSVRSFDGKGRHTTSRSQLYMLDDHTWLIDTPGMREMALHDFSLEDLAVTFPEIQALAWKCEFRDCKHLDEKGCAVTKALNLGDLPQFRYESYKRILDEILSFK
ncbi:MAG: ribosome small subunit-dependent GTPase A [Fibrobacteria bacterium]|nr:ribosome small subunit-dependent GTPase A [Fibrobacteria bacterium]